MAGYRVTGKEKYPFISEVFEVEGVQSQQALQRAAAIYKKECRAEGKNAFIDTLSIREIAQMFKANKVEDGRKSRQDYPSMAGKKSKYSNKEFDKWLGEVKEKL